MSLDAWGKLWDLVTDGEFTVNGKQTLIEVDSEDCGRATLLYGDGTRQNLVWDNGDWQLAEALSAGRAE